MVEATGGATRDAAAPRVMTREEAEAHLEREGGHPEAALDLSGVTWFHDGSEGDPSARLRACVRVMGSLAVLEALAVEVRTDDGRLAGPDEAGRMAFVDPDVDAGALWAAFEMQGHAETVEVVAGRRYAVFMSPACE